MRRIQHQVVKCRIAPVVSCIVSVVVPALFVDLLDAADRLVGFDPVHLDDAADLVRQVTVDEQGDKVLELRALQDKV